MSTTPDPDPPRRSDGERTHAAILDAAMAIASVEGLGSLTIGRLARELDISKSGVFAHFRSKQRLQQETVAAAGEVFEREVLAPGMQAPAGLGRVEGLCEAYLSYVDRGVFPGGCFFAQLIAEFDATDGPLHEAAAEGQSDWAGLLQTEIETAQSQGEIDAEVDADQLAFELDALLEMANFLATLHRDLSITERARTAISERLASAAVSVQELG